MLPIFFELSPSKFTMTSAGDAQKCLQTVPNDQREPWLLPRAFTAATQNWRGLTITKLTQSKDTISRLNNLPTKDLLLSVAAADLQIKLFFNCRPH